MLLIDAETLKRDGESLRVVDCSHDLEQPEAGIRLYREGHVPGAIHADLDRDLSGATTGSNGRHPLPDPRDLTHWLGKQGVTNAMQVVAYDRSGGMYAARLWWLLRWLGHEQVRLLDGGWQAWVEAGGAVETSTSHPTPAAYETRRLNPGMTVDAAQVLANIAMREALVVDARGAPRYQGVTEPIDARAGHIPGAVNRPFTDNLGPDGRFKPSTELTAEWGPLLAGRDGTKVIAQCGSGVTACHNLLAIELAGLGRGRLYPGSWSEWSSDPTRPVAVGAEPG